MGLRAIVGAGVALASCLSAAPDARAQERGIDLAVPFEREGTDVDAALVVMASGGAVIALGLAVPSIAAYVASLGCVSGAGGCELVPPLGEWIAPWGIAIAGVGLAAIVGAGIALHLLRGDGRGEREDVEARVGAGTLELRARF
jgi:hypothetical protein